MQLTSGLFPSSSLGLCSALQARPDNLHHQHAEPLHSCQGSPGTCRPQLLSRWLQVVLFLSVFRSAFVILDFSFFAAEFVMSPLGAGARLPEHEATSSPGEGTPTTASVHPLLRTFALPVIVLHGEKAMTAAETDWLLPVWEEQENTAWWYQPCSTNQIYATVSTALYTQVLACLGDENSRWRQECTNATQALFVHSNPSLQLVQAAMNHAAGLISVHKVQARDWTPKQITFLPSTRPEKMK